MISIYYLAFLIYFPTSIFGLYKMKSANSLLSLDFSIGLFAYFVGAMLWIVALRHFPLSFAFPFAAGLLIVGTQLTGIFILNETTDTRQLIAIALLIAGLILMGTRNPH
ncbi:SMR family transporter [Roseibium sp. MMSF_3544]|uniref:SMR family transporter n=1 Tax=unclassified Roseibium TaxID=2629323 RepID=UPI00273D6366|nr:SMR family transporter [Roseibium sp. MMSF_3544]